MKVSVECQSPLLQKSLEMFLANYLSSTKQCDIVVRDEECMNDTRCFYISSNANADLIKPFSKSQLILALEKKHSTMVGPLKDSDSKEERMDFSILEKRIDSLTREYQKNIINAVKVFYES